MRPIHVIAAEIMANWKKVNYAAQPYLQAMFSLSSPKDHYGLDTAESVVTYFLSNATSWRGDVAKRVKAELRAMFK